MPGPDPHAFWIDEDAERPTVVFENYLWTGNAGNRKARAISILQRLRYGIWVCHGCGEPLPDYKRADTRFCREACRKAAARRRRDARARARTGCSQQH